MEVIAHRGASGHRPEHTLPAYELGAEMGADWIEPDLVITRDGVLVARHDRDLAQTTDVADHPELGGRHHADELTLAELQTLRARERIPDVRPQNTAYDGRFAIPTFDEVIEVARRYGVGIYPETKHPRHFRDAGLPLEPPLLRALESAGVRAVIQSFDDANLRELARQTDVPLVQLLGRDATVDLDDIATYAQAIGVAIERTDARLVDDAHARGLEVHVFTVRAENRFLPPELRSSEDPAEHGDVAALFERLQAFGVDAVFADQPDAAVLSRESRPGR
jgi:glycerophosphoryl diester phosphodiesterase